MIVLAGGSGVALANVHLPPIAEIYGCGSFEHDAAARSLERSVLRRSFLKAPSLSFVETCAQICTGGSEEAETLMSLRQIWTSLKAMRAALARAGAVFTHGGRLVGVSVPRSG